MGLMAKVLMCFGFLDIQVGHSVKAEVTEL
jgi:hypothetical protein